MFNLAILDVAIGMIFVYLLLSLMCSAANEIIELALKKRAVDLERGIRELLAPGSRSGTDDVVQKLYNHPLVNSLFGGKYEKSRIASTIKRKIMRTALPSYIPSRTFALALMDLVLPGATAPPAGAGPAGAVAAPPATPSGAAGATPPPANFEVKLAAPPSPPPPITDPNNPLARLRSAVGANDLLTQHAKNALTPLIDAAGSDVAKARENIEGWYDASMDRVSSWYKRRTQIAILILGLFVAIAVNADTIMIAKRLSTDRALREHVVAAAQEHLRKRNEASPTEPKDSKPTSSPTPPAGAVTKAAVTQPSKPLSSPTAGSSPSNTAPSPESTASGSEAAGQSPEPVPNLRLECAKNPKAIEVAYEKNLREKFPECAKDRISPECKAKETPDCSKDPKSAGCLFEQCLVATVPACATDRKSAECKTEEKILRIPECAKNRNSPECRYQENLAQLQGLGLPIGWESPGDEWPGRNPGAWMSRIQTHLLGWLLTALAISLGAPFWFDLLNKFIVIRSAVKPHEKSPEEGPKD